jgi:hypothetical protein
MFKHDAGVVEPLSKGFEEGSDRGFLKLQDFSCVYPSKQEMI